MVRYMPGPREELPRLHKCSFVQFRAVTWATVTYRGPRDAATYGIETGYSIVKMIACTDLVEHSVVWLDRIATNALDGIATNGIREYYFNYVFNGSYAHRDACRTATTASSTEREVVHERPNCDVVEWSEPRGYLIDLLTKDTFNARRSYPNRMRC